MTSKLALCIGINDYPGTDSDLHGCVNDARDWSKALKKRGFNVKSLEDDGATGDAIRKELRLLARKARVGDVVVVTYSGHGTFVIDDDGDEEDGMDECWCPHDINENGPITDDELGRIYSSRADGVAWVVLSDSCHSGTVSRFSPIDTPPTTSETNSPERLARFLPPSVFIPEMKRGQGDDGQERMVVASPPGRNSAMLISGCQDAEYSYDAWFNGRPNGAFTFVALRALKALPPNSSYVDWHAQIRKSLPTQQYPQSPNIYGLPEDLHTEVFESSSSPNTGPSGNACYLSTSDSKAAKVGESLADEAFSIRSDARKGSSKSSRHATVKRKDRPVLVAEGDSWFDYPRCDVLSVLEDQFGYDVFPVSHRGDTVEDMAYSSDQLNDLIRTIERLKRNGLPVPSAILISAGGNDIAGDEFAQLLNHSRSHRRGLNDKVIEGVIDERLRDSYVTIITSVTSVCKRLFGRAIPIVVHGYDYAVPDGRGFLGGWWKLPGPWLKPGLDRKGYVEFEENKDMVETLIKRFNLMLASLEREPELGHLRVVHLLERLPNGDDYKKWWANELHPTRKGFRAVAKEFHLKISTV